jgi:hypothetical protein
LAFFLAAKSHCCAGRFDASGAGIMGFAIRRSAERQALLREVGHDSKSTEGGCSMGFLIALIPVGCCVAVPAVIAVAAFMSSSKRKKLQDNPERPVESTESTLSEQGRE